MKDKMMLLHRLSQGGHRYYLQVAGREEAAGVWSGAGARLGGLHGRTVTGPELRRLLPAGTERVPAFDATFAAPKSISILFGLGQPEVAAVVAAAHHDGVTAGLGYLESHACAVRCAGALTVAGGLTIAQFTHRTSRSLDPHLHTHALIVNGARAPDGRILALHSPLLYAERRAAGAVYQAVLRRSLTRDLGLEWEAPVSGRADAAIVPPAVRALFSTRTAQVRAAAAGQPEQRRWAARVTRPERARALSWEQLTRQWRQRAAEAGWNPVALKPHRARTGTVAPLTPPATERWTRAHLMVEAASAAAQGASLAELEARCAAVLRAPAVVRLANGAGHHGAARFSTATAVAARGRVEGWLGPVLDSSAGGLYRCGADVAAGGGRILVVVADHAAAKVTRLRSGVDAAAVADAVVPVALLGAADRLVVVRPERMEAHSLDQLRRVCRAPAFAGTPVPVAVAAPAATLLASARTGGGAVTAAPDPASAAWAALEHWGEVRSRHGVRAAVLVGPADEVAALNAAARSVLDAQGNGGGRTEEGWAAGDDAWFDADRPVLGVRRYEVGHVVAAEERGLRLLLSGGRTVDIGRGDLRSLRPALAVPAFPSLVAGRGLVVAVGTPPPLLRRPQPVHQFVTAAPRAGPAHQSVAAEVASPWRWATPDQLSMALLERTPDRSSPEAAALRDLRSLQDLARSQLDVLTRDRTRIRGRDGPAMAVPALDRSW